VAFGTAVMPLAKEQSLLLPFAAADVASIPIHLSQLCMMLLA